MCNNVPKVKRNKIGSTHQSDFNDFFLEIEIFKNHSGSARGKSVSLTPNRSERPLELKICILSMLIPAGPI